MRLMCGLVVCICLFALTNQAAWAAPATQAASQPTTPAATGPAEPADPAADGTSEITPRRGRYTDATTRPLTYPNPNSDNRSLATALKNHFGDAPDDAGPIATDLSPQLTPATIAAALRKVGDWEIKRGHEYFSKDWTWSTLYVGLSEADRIVLDAGYAHVLADFAEKNGWQLGARLEHADDQAVGQLYLELYLQQPDAKKITPIRARLDQVMASSTGDKWTWCDALFMAPPLWARLAKITGDIRYFDYLNKNWWLTTDALYDKDDRLFYRDKRYITKHEANGAKVFWSRGNGWVMGALVRVLRDMPANYPDRSRYVTLFQQMAARLVSLQDDNGLWHAALLDTGSYPQPENSGSALILYGLAGGINLGVLDRATYSPAVAKAWKGLLAHVHQDGRLDCIQQTGAAPAPYKLTSSYNFGVGGFLLAGSEISRMVQNDTAPTTAPAGVRIVEAADHLDVSVEGKSFTTYHFAATADDPEWHRPYFFPVLSADGIQLTADRDHETLGQEKREHPWHRSVWIGHGDVNGIDHWTHPRAGMQDPAQRKLQRHVRFTSITADTFVEELSWDGATADKPVLTEIRTVHFWADADGSRAMDVTSRFTAASGDVTFKVKPLNVTGVEAGWLAVRVSGEIAKSKQSQITSSAPAVGEKQSRELKANWCDYSGPIDGRIFGVAEFDSPANPGHPTPFHVREFGLMTHLGVHDWTLAFGKSQTFRHLLLFHPGDAKSAHLDERYATFAAQPAGVMP